MFATQEAPPFVPIVPTPAPPAQVAAAQVVQIGNQSFNQSLRQFNRSYNTQQFPAFRRLCDHWSTMTHG